jgi:hypothetical protein
MRKPLIYRVEFDYADRPEIQSLNYALDISPEREGVYESLKDLPQWMQDRLHVLSTFPSKPPTVEVEGIGRRIEEHIFWVYK